MKLDPLGKKGIFVGYSESSKAYRVYILGYKQIETSRDVTFDEDIAFSRSRQNHLDEVCDEEPEAPRVIDTDAKEHVSEDHDMEKPRKPKDPPQEMISYKRRLAWACEIIQDAKKYGAPVGYFRESKRPRTYFSYMALLSDIINAEPSSYTKAV